MSAKTGRDIFEGKSTNNDFQEALEAAIAAAKEGLTTELVVWQLEKVSGENGGFVPVRDLTVSIHAQVPSVPKQYK